MWYAIVTMSTVGYGDKVPVTGIGKMTTILWMFFGIISFGVFSGNVSSQIDLASAENNIFAPEVHRPWTLDQQLLPKPLTHLPEE